ncbi:methylated-DNA--[protein]-cysteine S-methyltransferase [Paludibacteraceae bacterium OttesenSCG-928-F17]|nr:methylated-DNA--[protein]-cysteine S-methyltransferase [Paludibacteraceae bacterium OttesenSCG-928-F17]
MDKVEFNSVRQAVYDVVRTIPYGRATSYGAIAKAIGYPNYSRLVGRIMANCNSAIPAHRVVNSQGTLSAKGAFGDGDEMKNLLEAEGIAVQHDKIKNWKKVFWNPLEEINL